MGFRLLKRLLSTEASQRPRERSVGRGTEGGSRRTDGEDQAAVYFATVSAGKILLLRVRERLHRSVDMVSQSCVNEFGRVSEVELVTMPPVSFVVIDGDTLHAGSALSSYETKRMSAPSTVRCAVRLANNGYSFLDAGHFLTGFMARFLNLLPAGSEKKLHFLLKNAYSDILRAQKD